MSPKAVLQGRYEMPCVQEHGLSLSCYFSMHGHLHTGYVKVENGCFSSGRHICIPTAVERKNVSFSNFAYIPFAKS